MTDYRRLASGVIVEIDGRRATPLTCDTCGAKLRSHPSYPDVTSLVDATICANGHEIVPRPEIDEPAPALCGSCGQFYEVEAGHACGPVPDAVLVAPVSDDFAPTDEQIAALEIFLSGRSMVIPALAGTGKTSTLKLMAEAVRNRYGKYVAFNKAIVADAKTRMPGNVECMTLHKLAMRAVGGPFRHRLDAPRQRSEEIARILHIEPMYVQYGVERKVLQPGMLASRVMEAMRNFCASADEVPSADQHMAYIDGIDVPNELGIRTWVNNNAVRRALEPAIRRAWLDLTNPNGQLRYSHDCYKKMYQLSKPRITGDFLLVDEAQDLTPCDEDIIATQTSLQIVLVGDSQQAIYGWKGCVDAMGNSPIVDRTPLTQSWRFGDVIASAANLILDRLDGDLRVVGAPGKAGVIASVAEPAAILCRTNARAVSELLHAQREGRRPCLIGGAKQVASFAKAAQDLKTIGRTSHIELASFTSWGQVQDYVANDPMGSELKLMVDLIDEFGVEVILAAVENMPSIGAADVVIGTAHSVKGLQWPSVRLAGDFPDLHDMESPELRLLYVAVTRAQDFLDVTACNAMTELFDEEGNDDDTDDDLPADPIALALVAAAFADDLPSSPQAPCSTVGQMSPADRFGKLASELGLL